MNQRRGYPGRNDSSGCGDKTLEEQAVERRVRLQLEAWKQRKAVLSRLGSDSLEDLLHGPLTLPQWAIQGGRRAVLSPRPQQGPGPAPAGTGVFIPEYCQHHKQRQHRQYQQQAQQEARRQLASCHHRRWIDGAAAEYWGPPFDRPAYGMAHAPDSDADSDSGSSGSVASVQSGVWCPQQTGTPECFSEGMDQDELGLPSEEEFHSSYTQQAPAVVLECSAAEAASPQQLHAAEPGALAAATVLACLG